MKKSLILLVLPLLLAGGCRDDNRPVTPVAGPPSLEDLVIANCYAVRDSAEAYAALNGEYPQDFPDYWLYNPFTGNLDEPKPFPAFNPGGTTYLSYHPGGKYVGYLIMGFGETGEIFRLYRNCSLVAFDTLVTADCYTVQAASEAFAAENNGVYADDVGVDATPAGNTITDLLPGDTLLENPFWKALTEPVDGAAALPGSTGYVDFKDASGTAAGYTIDGLGAQQTIITIRKFPGQQF
ncbi:MAG: hypothetical protein O7D32_00245 [bacterium]|nr:hypothetical protein [bacterium]